jgi:peroxiredoxin
MLKQRSSGFLAIFAAMLLCILPGELIASGVSTTAALASGSAQSSESGAQGSLAVGQVAPAWTPRGWVNAASLELKQLRGKVVFFRFISDETTGAEAISELYRIYHPRGLAVVGMYAPSPMPGETSMEHVRQLAGAHGFEFPIGVDSHWETLNRYWLDEGGSNMTSATFIIDGKGIVRYIQPDGVYEKNSPNRTARREYEKLEKAIETLLLKAQ